MNIEPINFGVLGTAEILNVKVLPFTTDAVKCDVYYELRSNTGKILFKGNLTLTGQEFAEWGADNSYIDNLVLSKFQTL